ncbi:hypothetical protein [Phormidesmis sp. 146-12]
MSPTLALVHPTFGVVRYSEQPVCRIEMMIFTWLVVAWLGGTAAILGSLMTIATLLLWLVPQKSPSWQNRLKLLGLSLGMAIVGFALLLTVPFPTISSH